MKTEVRLSEVSLLTPLSRGPVFEILKHVRKFCCSLWDGIFGIGDVSLTLLLVTKMYSQSGNEV